jgi:hypothetical protein
MDSREYADHQPAAYSTFILLISSRLSFETPLVFTFFDDLANSEEKTEHHC